MYTDKVLTCVDCAQQFMFTARDQEFYASRQFTEPRRCASCRATRKASRGDQGSAEPGYAGGWSSGGGYSAGGSGSESSYGDSGSYADSGGFGGGYSGGGAYGGGYSGERRAPREMFTTTCSSCGKEARVPFRPTNGKPVYCGDCFSSRR
jgi:CxxC-x17-CxxC domain-containing protein